MSCERYMEMLSARLDGELPPGEARELDAHLVRCPECQALAGQLAGLRADLAELEELAAPADLAGKVMSRVRQQDKPRVVPLFKRPQFRALAGLAACAVLCVGLWTAYQSGLPQGEVTPDIGLMTADGSMTKGERSIERGGDIPVTEPASVQPGDISDVEEPVRYELPSDGEEVDPASIEQSDPASVDGADAVLVLDRMPEGAMALLAGDTSVAHDTATGADTYTGLTWEQLSAIERLACEQGMTPGTAGACPEPVQCALVILDP